MGERELIDTICIYIDLFHSVEETTKTERKRKRERRRRGEERNRRGREGNYGRFCLLLSKGE